MGRVVVLVVITAALGGCASTGAVPRPFPQPGGSAPAGRTTPPPPDTTGSPGRPPRPSSASTAIDGYAISSTALSLRGAPYRNGGTDPGGFDCSGFVQYVFEQHGVGLPRDTRKQFEAGRQVDASSLEPGDLVFFTTVAPGASHVGISVGGDQFVHAPSSAGVVRVENLSSQYWASRFVGARRLN
jgi:cell wall-associated NlpC family hydrolase